jgi:hypothetical protein
MKVLSASLPNNEFSVLNMKRVRKRRHYGVVTDKGTFQAHYLPLAAHVDGFCEFCTISIALVPTK